MKVKTDDILVNDRYRKDLGELDGLMENIKKLGLLHPIGINRGNELVFGQRRLIASQMLGNDEIEARIVDVPSIEGEYSENEFRKNFTVSERVAIGEVLEERIGERRGGNHGNQFKSAKVLKVADCRNKSSGKETREIAAVRAGFGSRETYRRAKEVKRKGTPELMKKVDNGKVSISAAYKEVKREEKKLERVKRFEEAAKHYEPSKSHRIINADFFTWCADNLEDDSVDLILTDPPYSKEYLYVWEQLCQTAVRKLKPGGYLAAYSGQLYLPDVMKILGEKLSYCWMISLQHNGKTQLVHARNTVCKWKPILIYRKGEPGKFEDTLVDFIADDYREKDFHEWGQGENAVGYLMKKLSQPNDLVLDPFVGGGTTMVVAKGLKRKCIGIEIEEKYIDVIKSRLSTKTSAQGKKER